MPALIYSCDNEIIDPQQDPCLTEMEHGRIRSVAYVHSSIVDLIKASPTNKQAWDAQIAQGKIYIIPEVIGSYDGGAAVEAPGYGDEATRTTGYNFSANFRDPNYKGNCGFYNTIKKSKNWHLAFRTENLTRITDKPVSIQPKDPITEDLTAEVVWDVTNKWTQTDHSCPFTTPEGVFVHQVQKPVITYQYGYAEIDTTGTPPSEAEYKASVNTSTNVWNKASTSVRVEDFKNTDDKVLFVKVPTPPAAVMTKWSESGNPLQQLQPIGPGLVWNKYTDGNLTVYYTPAQTSFAGDVIFVP